MRILAIDDDADFLAAMKLTAEAKGHMVTGTHNWLSFMLELRNHEFDAIIADIETPTGNGLTAIGFLNEDEAIRNIPKVFVTGRCDPSTVSQCRSLNARYLHKSPDVFDHVLIFLDDVAQRDVAMSLSV